MAFTLSLRRRPGGRWVKAEASVAWLRRAREAAKICTPFAFCANGLPLGRENIRGRTNIQPGCQPRENQTRSAATLDFVCTTINQTGGSVHFQSQSIQIIIFLILPINFISSDDVLDRRGMKHKCNLNILTFL